MDKLKQYSESECSLAARVFTDEHYGSAITEKEAEYREKLTEAYKIELSEAKAIVLADPTFNEMTYEDKIIYCIELLKKLRIKNHGSLDVQIEVASESKEQYADLNDLLNTIPQEPYEPILKDDISSIISQLPEEQKEVLEKAYGNNLEDNKATRSK